MLFSSLALGASYFILGSMADIDSPSQKDFSLVITIAFVVSTLMCDVTGVSVVLCYGLVDSDSFLPTYLMPSSPRS